MTTDDSDHSASESEGFDESTLYGPSGLRSLILIQIIPMERTLSSPPPRGEGGVYESISMTKFNNLKVKRVKSNLKYTESKLEKKITLKRRNTKKATMI